jgi:hypothetical protein
MPTTHNETVNKARLVFLHCITAGQKINVGRIILQEIVNCPAKKSKEGMFYFPALSLSCVRRFWCLKWVEMKFFSLPIFFIRRL